MARSCYESDVTTWTSAGAKRGVACILGLASAWACAAGSTVGSAAPAGPVEPASAISAPADARAPAARGEPEPEKTPETVFSELERRLAQRPLRLRFEATSEGAFEAAMTGELAIADEVELSVTGRFGELAVDSRLWTQGDRLRAGPRGAPTLDVPRPPELEAALVIGLVRMGVLHNVARLVAGAPPDHGDGGVTDWVQAIDLAHATPPDGAGDGLRFGLVVAGQPSGSAALWLDAHGLPRWREQTVEFPGGQMRVVERYEWLASPALPPPPGGG